MVLFLLGALLAQNPAVAAGVIDLTQLAVSAPRMVLELDTGKMGGSPVRLAWAPDGALYVRVTEIDRWGNERSKHFAITVDGKAALRPIDGEPAWLAAYWSWKAATIAPGVPTMKLDVEQRRERKSVVNTPGSGELAGMASPATAGAGGGQGTSGGVAANAANNSFMIDTTTMRYKGELIAEWSGTTPQPGVQIGWAPAPLGVLAYVTGKKRLGLIDHNGQKREVDGAENVTLPAWSADGKSIAFLQKNKKKYSLMIVEIDRRPVDGRR